MFYDRTVPFPPAESKEEQQQTPPNQDLNNSTNETEADGNAKQETSQELEEVKRMSGPERLEYYCREYWNHILEKNRKFHLHNRIFSKEFKHFSYYFFQSIENIPLRHHLQYPFEYNGPHQ